MTNINLGSRSSIVITISSIIEILRETGYENRIPYLEDILQTINDQHIENFKSLVINNELFGGSGALWEIYIENPKLSRRYKKLFFQFIREIERMGIKNPRITQIKEVMK